VIKYDGPERRLHPNGSVTWKWVAGGMMTISTLLGATWLNSLTTKTAAIEIAQSADRKETQDVKTKATVIEEKVRRIEEDVKDVKEQQKDTNKKLDETGRKLDELLRRTK
jgi:peptidoglycan hydrolase CwlO-like protein